ncbi:hypothetical protein [Candidatus Mycalebacterium sp.]
MSEKKEFHDGAIPCGNSVAAMNLVKISRITGDSEFAQAALETISSLSLSIEKIPSSHTMLLCAMEFEAGAATEIVIACDNEDETKAVAGKIETIYAPNRTVVLKKTDDKEIDKIAPFAANCKPVNGKAAVYVCENGACGLPVEASEFIGGHLKTEKKG